MYQSDYPDNKWLYEDGCLLMTLIHCAESLVDRELSCYDFHILLNRLLEKKAIYNPEKKKYIPVITDENDIDEPGAYVWNHDVVLNETLRFLGSPMSVIFSGCQYTQPSPSKLSWGAVSSADFVILNIKTPHGGHFLTPSFGGYDPWKEGTIVTAVKSIRYYQIKGD